MISWGRKVSESLVHGGSFNQLGIHGNSWRQKFLRKTYKKLLKMTIYSEFSQYKWVDFPMSFLYVYQRVFEMDMEISRQNLILFRIQGSYFGPLR
jgi:hypothetical protein